MLYHFLVPGSEKPEGAVQAIKLLKGAYRFFMLPTAAGYYFLVYRAYMIFDTPKELLESWRDSIDWLIVRSSHSKAVILVSKGSLVEKRPSYGDLKMQRVQKSNSSVK